VSHGQKPHGTRFDEEPGLPGKGPASHPCFFNFHQRASSGRPIYQSVILHPMRTYHLLRPHRSNSATSLLTSVEAQANTASTWLSLLISVDAEESKGTIPPECLDPPDLILFEAPWAAVYKRRAGKEELRSCALKSNRKRAVVTSARENLKMSL